MRPGRGEPEAQGLLPPRPPPRSRRPVRPRPGRSDGRRAPCGSRIRRSPSRNWGAPRRRSLTTGPRSPRMPPSRRPGRTWPCTRSTEDSPEQAVHLASVAQYLDPRYETARGVLEEALASLPPPAKRGEGPRETCVKGDQAETAGRRDRDGRRRRLGRDGGTAPLPRAAGRLARRDRRAGRGPAEGTGASRPRGGARGVGRAPSGDRGLARGGRGGSPARAGARSGRRPVRRGGGGRAGRGRRLRRARVPPYAGRCEALRAARARAEALIGAVVVVPGRGGEGGLAAAPGDLPSLRDERRNRRPAGGGWSAGAGGGPSSISARSSSVSATSGSTTLPVKGRGSASGGDGRGTRFSPRVVLGAAEGTADEALRRLLASRRPAPMNWSPAAFAATDHGDGALFAPFTRHERRRTRGGDRLADRIAGGARDGRWSSSRCRGPGAWERRGSNRSARSSPKRSRAPWRSPRAGPRWPPPREGRTTSRSRWSATGRRTSASPPGGPSPWEGRASRSPCRPERSRPLPPCAPPASAPGRPQAALWFRGRFLDRDGIQVAIGDEGVAASIDVLAPAGAGAAAAGTRRGARASGGGSGRVADLGARCGAAARGRHRRLAGPPRTVPSLRGPPVRVGGRAARVHRPDRRAGDAGLLRGPLRRPLLDPFHPADRAGERPRPPRSTSWGGSESRFSGRPPRSGARPSTRKETFARAISR